MITKAAVDAFGETFMMALENRGEHVPRYLIHVKSQSELISRLQDIFVRCRLRNN